MVTVNAKKSYSKSIEIQRLPDGQVIDPQNQSDSSIAKTEQSSPNLPPRAHAGNNKIVIESEKVHLNAGNSVDPDGDELSYTWQLVSPKNVKIKLHDGNSVNPDFVAPNLDGTANKLTLIIRLTVSDGDFQSSDNVKILVTSKHNNKDDKIKTKTVVDTGSPPTNNQFFTEDVCGDGTSVYSYLVQGIKWKTFPVTYGFDLSKSTYDQREGVRHAFYVYDALGQPAGSFFKETTYAAAQIKITWTYIDGPYNQLGKTSISYRTDTHTITSGTITFDSGDKYFNSPTERCGTIGNQFDMQNIATHEIGHAINLGHVSDKLQSMYPTSFAGETLKRTLGNGDKAAVSNLY